MAKIGVYGPKTRKLQSRLTRQAINLSQKCANVHLYLGSKESVDPEITDIQSTTFFEVPDRAYQLDTISIDIYFEAMSESALDFSRFGMISPVGNENTIKVHVDDMKCKLGRWLVVGDIIEVPFFERDGKKAYWEVTDVDDKPSYEKFYVTVSMSPLGDTRETRDIAVDRSDIGINDRINTQQDQSFDEMVPFEGITAPDETPPADPEPVDNRRDKQGSFLDDPDKTY